MAQPYASRYTHILSLVESYLLEARQNNVEIPKSRFTARLARRRDERDGRDGFWAVLDHMAATTKTKELSGLVSAPSDFRTSATLGSGRFGTVEVVSSAYDGQLYAMKTISKAAIQRSGSLASIGIERHIHLFAARQQKWVLIPSLHAAFQSSESLHLVIQLAPCGSLWDRMGLNDEPFPFASPVKFADTDDVRKMDASEIRWWACQMVEAIAWLHEQGFAHRDVKPQNFLIDESARILLTDFGVAAPLESVQGAHSVSAKDCAVPAGTPDYIAPEVLLAGEAAAAAAWSDVEAGSEVTYTASIDHWSLGATLYEMATGQAPFIARSIAGTYKRIQAYDLNRGILHRHCTDPALLSLIVSLLCPASDRLDTADLRRHPFFAMTEWENIRSGTAVPPHDLAPITPRGLEDEPTLGQSQFSFSLAPRYDQTSPASNFADFTQFTQTYSDPSEWLGWTFMPDPADLRDSVPAHVSPVKLDVDDRYRTPRRQTSGTSFKPPPSTAKRVPKKTPGSNPYFDLLKCVHDSARKKRTSSQHKAPQQVTIDAVERDVTKLIGQLQGLRTRLDKITQ